MAIVAGLIPSGDFIIVISVLVLAVASWRYKRGDFYKGLLAERDLEIADLKKRLTTAEGEIIDLKQRPNLEGIASALVELGMSLRSHETRMEQAVAALATTQHASADTLGEISESLHSVCDALIKRSQ